MGVGVGGGGKGQEVGASLREVPLKRMIHGVPPDLVQPPLLRSGPGPSRSGGAGVGRGQGHSADNLSLTLSLGPLELVCAFLKHMPRGIAVEFRSNAENAVEIPQRFLFLGFSAVRQFFDVFMAVLGSRRHSIGFGAQV